MPVEIDITQVPQGKRSDQRFLYLSTQLQTALSQPDFIKLVCIHEAAHHRYQLRLGATSFEYHGPRIVYDEERDKFGVFSAAVRATAWNSDFSNQDAKDLLHQMAIIGVAGELATIAIEGTGEGSGLGDYLAFNEIYEKIGKAAHGACLDIWYAAQKYVADDLQKAEVRSEILTIATAIEPQLFGVR